MLKPRFHRLRKDSIFRLYLFVFATGCALGMYAVVHAQASSNSRLVARLESRISELEARSTTVAVNPEQSDGSKATDVADEPESPIVRAAREERDSLFWVEGHGYNKRYAYLDLEFRDGYRARYYFRPFPEPRELANLHRRIEHDALTHYFPLDILDDS